MPTSFGHLRDFQRARNCVEKRKSSQQKGSNSRDGGLVQEDQGSQSRIEEVHATGQEAKPREKLLPRVRQTLCRPQTLRVE